MAETYEDVYVDVYVDVDVYGDVYKYILGCDAVKKKADKDKLAKWQDRFTEAKAKYDAEIQRMSVREDYYNGCKDIYNADGKKAEKKASNTRNIIFELIESQVESTYPTPKVTPYREVDEDAASEIEDMLRNEMDRLQTERMNDTDERTTPIQGGNFYLVEWDSTQRTHTTLGEISVQLLHPRKVIPQQGVESLEQSDWVFVELAQTKEYIKRRYDIDVTEENEVTPEVRGKGKDASEHMVTQVIVYYRNHDGGIGRFSWVNDTILEDLEDYQAPMQKRCKQCDALFTANHEECPYCGSEKLSEEAMEYIELEEDIVLYEDDGITPRKVIPAYTQTLDGYGMPLEEQMTDDMGYPLFDPVVDAMGSPVLDMLGSPQMVPRMQPVMEKTRIPVYKPNKFPIIVRKNVSIDGKFLGNSDVDFIKDQQNEINKYLTKVGEKTLKGGSLVAMPMELNVDDTDEDMKLVKYRNPAEADGIRVFNLQADFSGDMEMAERNYEWGRQTVGITDSFQGRKDSTATSGKAKEFSAAQAAGRFESKKIMKRAAYADLYQIMFMFMLAYADEPREFKAMDKLGHDVYRTFNKWDFLEQDEAGEWYWNDRFMFSTDNSGNLAQNREALWQETRSNFESGAFGNPQDINVLIMYWTMMKEMHYPIAATVLTNLEQQKEQQEQMMAQQQAMMQQQMAMQNQMGMPPQGQVVI